MSFKLRFRAIRASNCPYYGYADLKLNSTGTIRAVRLRRFYGLSQAFDQKPLVARPGSYTRSPLFAVAKPRPGGSPMWLTVPVGTSALVRHASAAAICRPVIYAVNGRLLGPVNGLTELYARTMKRRQWTPDSGIHRVSVEVVGFHWNPLHLWVAKKEQSRTQGFWDHVEIKACVKPVESVQEVLESVRCSIYRWILVE
ncbi:hypothetical protein C8J57DRAFT_1222761 [Mycena rebaudengoi]|nr:hypothetical protein C8J57DRAFT_1222761 [Mycena rebaudengoi]